ncbi:MAG: hypothetical protein ACOCYT_05610 [Chloroflexota bacterium]
MSLRKAGFSLILALLFFALVGGPATAQENDPVDMVENFYSWYLDYAGYDETADVFRNPIADGSYRDRAELSPAMISRIDAEHERFADPFLCAQDIPGQATFAPVDAHSVLVSLHFGGNPHPHNVLVMLDADGLIDGVNCAETVTPRGTVHAFYTAYITNREAVDIGNHPLLTDAFGAQLAETLANPIPLGEGDPVVCAQDRPVSIAVDPVYTDEAQAVMIVRTFFGNNPDPHSLTVTLAQADRWQIDAIACEVTAETAAAYLYNEFVAYIRHDIDHGIERVPLQDWSPHPWQTYLNAELYNELIAAYTSDDALPADPFLCAQDLPTRITTEADGETVRITGLYPAGPESFTSYALAEMTMAQAEDGTWQAIDITCAR